MLLSLDGGGHLAYLSTDAQAVAAYLWKAYLGGRSDGVRRPLGYAVLDGIDLSITGTTSNLYWDYLVRYLSEYSTKERKVYLSAAPQCPYPDYYYLQTTIATGLLDYVWVQFFDNSPCEYHAHTNDTGDLLRSWDTWATSIKAGKLLMGLLAGNETGESGYMPPNITIDKVLPVIKNYTLYGAMKLRDRFMDNHTNYSGQVYPYTHTHKKKKVYPYIKRTTTSATPDPVLLNY